MLALPNLDGTGSVAVCPECPNAPVIPLSGPGAEPAWQPIEASPEVTSRLGRLLSSGDEGAWPEALLDQLPEEAQRLLRGGRREKQPAAKAGLREELESSLRDQGIIVTEDSRGVRLTYQYIPGKRPRAASLSPTDIVRLAAELDGGVRPLLERIHCPKCDAVIPAGEKRCQWCGQALDSQADAPDKR